MTEDVSEYQKNENCNDLTICFYINFPLLLHFLDKLHGNIFSTHLCTIL